ncbi:E3 ubiquitin-protein ligase RNF115-like [Actinia tenebrosa]|uniref:E3 ubiquitin-protein ligase RNF115-like n=1 Tax=Actinia tenebrosa TaxID=6105 RepID=A0A6P8IMD8_ACTTE|nr:E3 ubiquitin-protein ligase RNF115-like [Actinia tenebrosa]
MFESMMPSAPLPPQLVFGSEILLLALIRQFIESHSEFQSEDTPPGALPEVIESLIKKKVTKDILDSSSSCCICQNDYALDEMITCLPCNHVYHGPCITTWLKMHATCPTCRDVLPH